MPVSAGSFAVARLCPVGIGAWREDGEEEARTERAAEPNGVEREAARRGGGGGAEDDETDPVAGAEAIADGPELDLVGPLPPAGVFVDGASRSGLDVHRAKSIKSIEIMLFRRLIHPLPVFGPSHQGMARRSPGSIGRRCSAP